MVSTYHGSLTILAIYNLGNHLNSWKLLACDELMLICVDVNHLRLFKRGTTGWYSGIRRSYAGSLFLILFFLKNFLFSHKISVLHIDTIEVQLSVYSVINQRKTIVLYLKRMLFENEAHCSYV